MAEDDTFNRGPGGGNIRFGTTRSTTTSSGVYKIPTHFTREVFGGIAWDDDDHFRRADLSFGTESTFYSFIPLVTDRSALLTARFRVYRHRGSSDLNATFTLASSVTGIRARYFLFGH